MLKVLFAEWGTGRLGQGQFALFYFAVVGFLAAWGILVFGVGIFAVSQFEVNDLEKNAGGLAIAMFGTFALIAAAWFNIVVKRGRDAGIPGIVSSIGFILLFLIGGVPLFATILLAALPTKTVG